MRYCVRSTVLITGIYRLHFFSNEPNEPAHAGEVLAGSRCTRPPKNAMNASHSNAGERVRNVHFTEGAFAVDLVDGRTIIVPLVWYPRLLDATMEQRSRWKMVSAGYGIHWPDLDEDLSTEGLL